jgi:hypothetical protein
MVPASIFLAGCWSLFLSRLRKYALALPNSFHEAKKGPNYLTCLEFGYMPISTSYDLGFSFSLGDSRRSDSGGQGRLRAHKRHWWL